MTDAVGQRPIIVQPLVFGHPECPQTIGQCSEMTFFHIENDVVPIPMLNLEIADHLRAKAVNRDVTVLAELLPPIFKWLFS